MPTYFESENVKLLTNVERGFNYNFSVFIFNSISLAFLRQLNYVL